MSERPLDDRMDAPARAGAYLVSAREELEGILGRAGIVLNGKRLDEAVADYLELREKLSLIRATIKNR